MRRKLRDKRQKEAEERCRIFTKLSLQDGKHVRNKWRRVKTDAANFFRWSFLFLFYLRRRVLIDIFSYFNSINRLQMKEGHSFRLVYRLFVNCFDKMKGVIPHIKMNCFFNGKSELQSTFTYFLFSFFFFGKYIDYLLNSYFYI